MNNARPHPGSAEPNPTDPAPGDDALAARELAGQQLDEISAIAMDLLRVLQIEVRDPWNSPTSIPGEWVRAADPSLAYVRLSRSVRLNLGAGARNAPGAEDGPGAAVRRQEQGRLVAEMSAIGMDLLRVLQQEVVDPDKAPTAGQGLRVGAGDPALALYRLSRAVRMNHAIAVKIAEGTLGRQRQRRAGAPMRPAGAAEAVAPVEAGDAAKPAPGSISAELRAVALRAAETEGVESEREDWAAECEDFYDEEDEFGCLDGLLPEEILAYARKEFDRAVRTMRPGGPDAGAAEPPSAAPLASQPPAVLRRVPPGGATGAVPGQSDGAPARAVHMLRPPGRDPP